MSRQNLAFSTDAGAAAVRPIAGPTIHAIPFDASAPAHARHTGVAVWLFLAAAMCTAMVVVGGLTRLSRSGLSIVEWAPVTGILPPLNVEQWNAAFASYRATPEGMTVNASISFEGFQRIYLVEWAHRLLGRITGMVVFVPFLWFLARGALRGVRAWRIVGIFLLGGVQGFLGWFMVKSGLVDDPHVSHYRLTLHLGMALTIFSLLMWCALDELAMGRRWKREGADPWVRRLSWTTIALIATTVVWGGFMAGLHAGHVAPTFPAMNGAWIPSGMFIHTPAWLGLFENALTIHFVHRLLAYTTALAVVATFIVVRRRHASHAARMTSAFLLGAVLLQVVLGAFTVLRHVPIALASLHQTNALFVLGSAVALAFMVRPARERT